MRKTTHNELHNMNQRSLFASQLDVDERSYLIDHGLLKEVPAGTVICKQDATDNDLFILLFGEVKVYEKLNSQTLSLGKLSSGELFGEIAALLTVPRIATVESTINSVVLELQAQEFAKLISTTPKLRELVYNRLYQRSRETTLLSLSDCQDQQCDRYNELSHILQQWGKHFSHANAH